MIAFGRPYTTDFLGWLDDFSTTGGFYDALGASTRVFISVAENTTGGPPKREQFRRCPGGADVPARDGSMLDPSRLTVIKVVGILQVRRRSSNLQP